MSDDRLDRIEGKLDHVLKILNGNGEPGLCEHVRDNEAGIADNLKSIKWLRRDIAKYVKWGCISLLAVGGGAGATPLVQKILSVLGG